jgi:hypothetical protein
MLKTKDKVDNKVNVRMVSRVKATVSNKIPVKDKAKVKVRVKEVTVVECLRKCRTSTTDINRLLMIWLMHNRIKDRDKAMVSPIS